MALSGEGAVCIWNDITPEGEADFYAWHIEEHMPERVGIPGFLRGRRYIAADGDTAPKYFTLYETVTPEVMTGQDYLGRLNAPTEWTKRATREFRNTFRALTRVRASFGQGPGGALATLRMVLGDSDREIVGQKLAQDVLPKLAHSARITGLHLCTTDMAASAGRTAETRDRSDIQEPPNTVVLIEGCGLEAVVSAARGCLSSGAVPDGETVERGVYTLEYTRLKTAWGAG